ncbi:Lnb N-terminal periplasmic domain-containing protein [Flavobacterium pallidum]|uniref:Lnb N-terminal periplasmic domain-containing protein n=1 Tax=Flavobacterium pallidum TaxID=2172098 RepID=A0A2S1SH29_9FLAO|nr:DUF4105 domain-containing protein [Flavobacterium pallidum]AWI25685.1 hypothetical protein HYN49_07100 [Flavobacterium pallidum]
MLRNNTILYFLLLILLPAAVFPQSGSLSANAKISVLTCDTGNELYSLFGHTAIRVDDPVNNIDVVFNYGAFDFSTPNFYLKFTKGDLQYFIVTSTFADFCQQYIYENRGVYEQELNLTQPQKQKIFNELVASLSSADKYYTYKFIDRNCTTKVADRINANIDGKLSLDVKGSKESNRRIIYGYVQNQFYENLGINIMFGARTDADFYKVFLPLQLLESISKTKNGSQPLTHGVKTINKPSLEANGFSFWNSIWSLIGLLLLIVLVNRKIITLTFLTFQALLGLFLISAGIYSLHHELTWNYNIFLFNPLLLFTVALVMRQKTKRAIQSIYVCLAMLAVYLMFLLNKVQLWMFLPMILANAVLLLRLLKQQMKLLPAVK